MELDEKLEERKRGNAPFLTAFEHVRTMLGLTKGKLCELLNVKASRLSEWDKGEKPVPEPLKYALIDLSVKKDIGQISIDYLDGYTNIMLLANIPDEELAEIKMRRANPDYFAIKERLKKKEQQIEQAAAYIDPSSQQNAAISVYIQYTNHLSDKLKEKEIEMKERLAEKDTLIRTLESTITDKETIIKSLNAKIVELERKLAATVTSDIERYPFVIGAAEHEFSFKQQ